MSLLIEQPDRPVHIPKNPDHFEFDSEVAQIFENMAQRAIPMYAEFHRMHCRMLLDRFFSKCTVLDIGASTGRWFREMRRQLKVTSLSALPQLSCYAFDNSEAMIEKLRGEFPEVHSRHLDLLDPAPTELQGDVVVLFYVLQFLPPNRKRDALRWIFEHTAQGGTLLLGQKEFHPQHDEMFQEEYIKFRMDNGYTRSEIAQKTRALRTSMWCLQPEELRDMLYSVGYSQVIETTRWLHFSTWMVRR